MNYDRLKINMTRVLCGPSSLLVVWKIHLTCNDKFGGRVRLIAHLHLVLHIPSTPWKKCAKHQDVRTVSRDKSDQLQFSESIFIRLILILSFVSVWVFQGLFFLNAFEDCLHLLFFIEGISLKTLSDQHKITNCSLCTLTCISSEFNYAVQPTKNKPA